MMTPIQYIGYFECIVFTVDYANIVDIQAVAPNPQKAQWVAQGLGEYHRTEVKKVDGMPLARYHQ